MELLRFQQKIGYTFLDKQLLLQALTHKSYCSTNNNENLVFVGNKIYTVAVTTYVLQQCEKDVFVNSKRYLNKHAIAKIAVELGVPTIACIGEKTIASMVLQNNTAPYGNILQAVIGAIWCDCKSINHISDKIIKPFLEAS